MYNTVYARSGRQWDYSYMKSLGLDFIDVHDYKNFFEEDPPNNFMRNAVIEELFNQKYEEFEFDDDCSDTVLDFINSLKNVFLQKKEESTVDDLGKNIFKLLGYGRNKKLSIFGPSKLKYIISGQNVEANPDIQIRNINNNIILLTQEDKSYKVVELNDFKEAEPQLVAEMIAACYNNNEYHEGNLKNQKIYGIVMLGTHSTFYKFEMSDLTLKRITNGIECEEILDHIQRFAIGEKDPSFILNRDNLLKTLKCYESLRKLIFKLSNV
ncbi:hypothetical protein HDV06_001697 [Boothiomyces sp. JEL0866]|nr:hypothetical protein HDV06_001697 [Boothiomyces sp. JEL0866]